MPGCGQEYCRKKRNLESLEEEERRRWRRRRRRRRIVGGGGRPDGHSTLGCPQGWRMRMRRGSWPPVHKDDQEALLPIVDVHAHP